MKSRFEFYEVVRIIDHPKLSGLEGTILGMSQDKEKSPEWAYSVFIDKLGEAWFFIEDEIEATGKMKKREDYYSGSSIKVIVDSETSEGDLAK